MERLIEKFDNISSGNGQPYTDTDSKFLISGGNPLNGTVRVSGAKNSASKLLVASMLSTGKSTLHNSPNKISDLILTKQICESFGSNINIHEDLLNVCTPEVTSSRIDEDLGNKTRIAILLSGPLLHRTGF